MEREEDALIIDEQALPLHQNEDVPNQDDENNTFYLRENQINLSDIVQKLPPLESLKSIELFAASIITLDQDLKLPGIDLVIVAPLWMIPKPIVIDLSGKSGKEGGQNELNGLPGDAGQNGGNFFGTGRSLIGQKNLTIKVNGGKGGKGGNGRDGKDGQNGGDGDRDEVKQRKETALIRREKVPFSEGRAEFLVESLMTFNDRFHSEYTSQGALAENGQNGGMGGKGGFGGLPGKIIIEGGVENALFETEKREGSRGENGVPGKPGRGGIGGITFTGIYLESIAFPSRRSGYQEEKTPGIGGFGTATVATVGVTGTKIAAQRTAQMAVMETSKQVVKQATQEVLKGTGKALTKEAAQELGKEMTKQIAVTVGEETMKKVGSAFIKESVTPLVTGTIGGTLQGTGKEAVRQMARSAGKELGSTAALAGKGAFSFGSFASSLGLSLLVQAGCSLVVEQIRKGWVKEIECIKENDGTDGLCMIKLNQEGMQQQHQQKEVINPDVINAKYESWLLDLKERQ